MALISAKTILTSLSFFHMTLAYFFFTNPNAIADQTLVYVLGEAMGMPNTNFLSTPSPATSILAVILFVIGISDLITLSMPEEIWLVHYWGAQAPVRITLFLILTMYSFLSAPASLSRSRSAGSAGSSSRFSHPDAPWVGSSYGSGSGAEGLRNRVFFTLAFLETLSWFWAWVTIREEASAFAGKKRRRGSRGSEGSMGRM
ncbi:increased loss of mitochondrial DNA protein 1 [Xylariomycetidae sp. FL2044]|nr:increased loss of mitochondrial DNA protein 1 [Xylariomycetidae sp. FL2044]